MVRADTSGEVSAEVALDHFRNYYQVTPAHNYYQVTPAHIEFNLG